MPEALRHLLARSAFRLFAGRGGASRLSVFIFHRVLPERDPLLPWEPSIAEFDRIVSAICAVYRVLPLSEAAARLRDGSLPAASAAITFDDGYLDNLTLAAPVLAKHGAVATFFIATGFLDGGRMWNDDVIEAVRSAPAPEIDWSEFGLGRYPLGDNASRVACYSAVLGELKYRPHDERAATAREIARRAGLSERSDLMMTSDELRRLHSMGMEIGAHTRTHPILRLLDDRRARDEIAGGRDELEHKIGGRVSVFAYPNGAPGRDYTARDVRLVEGAGFAAAVTTAAGVSCPATSAYQLRRFTPWDRTPGRFLARSLANLVRGPRSADPLQS